MTYSLREKAQFYSQLHVAVHAGIPLELALSEKSLPKSKHTSAQGLSQRIRSGKPLSQLLGESRLVSPWETKMLAIGEEAGALPAILENLADYFGSKDEQFRYLKSKLVYPFMLILAVIIIPALPGLASGSISVTEYLFKAAIQIFIVFLVYDVLIRKPFRNSSSGAFNTVVINCLPLVGNNHLFRRIFEVAYLDLLTLCLQCGMNVGETLRILEDCIPTKHLKQRHRQARIDVEKSGHTLVQALYDNSILENREIRSFLVTAEHSGTLHRNLRVYVHRKKQDVASDVNFRIRQINWIAYTIAVVMAAGSILGESVVNPALHDL